MSDKHTPQTHSTPRKSDKGDKAKSRPTDTPIDPSAEIMKKYGIERVSVDHFHIGAFRYTNLDDAIAQAKRQSRDGP